MGGWAVVKRAGSVSVPFVRGGVRRGGVRGRGEQDTAPPRSDGQRRGGAVPAVRGEGARHIRKVELALARQRQRLPSGERLPPVAHHLVDEVRQTLHGSFRLAKWCGRRRRRKEETKKEKEEKKEKEKEKKEKSKQKCCGKRTSSQFWACERSRVARASVCSDAPQRRGQPPGICRSLHRQAAIHSHQDATAKRRQRNSGTVAVTATATAGRTRERQEHGREHDSSDGHTSSV